MKAIFLFSFLFAGATFCEAGFLTDFSTNVISTNAGITDVVYAAGRYVAVGTFSDTGEVYHSTNGIDWTLSVSNPDAWGLGITYSDGRFVGVSPVGVVVTSTNGITWQQSYLSFGFYTGETDITYGGSRYVSVGPGVYVPHILTSTNAQDWTECSAYPGFAGPIASVAYNGSRFVAIGNNDGYAYTSTTGTGTWTRMSIPGGNRVFFCNGRFFVPLAAGTNLISNTGLTWQAIPTQLTNQLGRMSYVNGVYMARAYNPVFAPTNVAYLATSTDGTNWFQYPTPLPKITPDADTVDIASDGFHLVVMSATTRSYIYHTGYVHVSGVLGSLEMQKPPTPAVRLTGLIGRQYRLLSSAAADAPLTHWNTESTFTLTNASVDLPVGSFGVVTRFYSGELLP